MSTASTYKFSRVSSNSKLGPIPMVISSPDTCPHSCPLKGQGCYAEQGPVLWQWRKTSDSFEETCANIRALPKDTLWRYGVAGDLPSQDQIHIDAEAADRLARANRGKRGFLYTHYPVELPHNQEVIERMVKSGLTVNLSADSLDDADRKASLGIAPVVTLLPKDAGPVTYTPEGRRVVRCPATANKKITCSSCGICQKAERSAIIGFPVHGVRWKAAERIFAN